MLSQKLTLSCEKQILTSNIIFVNGSSGSGKTTLTSKIASHILDNQFVGRDREKLTIVDFSPKSSNHSELLTFGRLLNINVNSISTLTDLVDFIDINKDERKLIIDVSPENKNTVGYQEYLEKLYKNEIELLKTENNKLIAKNIVFYKKNKNLKRNILRLKKKNTTLTEPIIINEEKINENWDYLDYLNK